MAVPTKSAAIYVRLSRLHGEDSASKGRSLIEQEIDTRATADRLGLNVVEIFKEREGTGASRRSGKRRPQWERALAALDSGEAFRTLLVWELSRADRRGWAALDGMVTKLGEKDRRLLGVDGTDLTDPARRLENVIRAEMARQEAENTAARVERAKRADRLAGRWPGGVAPFGLRIGADRRLEPDPDTYPTARAMRRPLSAGRRCGASCKRKTGCRVAPLRVCPGWRRSPKAGSLASGSGEYAPVARSRSTQPGPLAPCRPFCGRSPSLVWQRGEHAKPCRRAGSGPPWALSMRCRLQLYGMTAKYPEGFLRCGAYATGRGCATPAQGPRSTVERHVLAQVWGALIWAQARGLALWDAVQSAWREAERADEDEAIAAAQADVQAATVAVERLEDLLADGLLDRAAYTRQRARKTEALAAAQASLAALAPDEPVYGDEPWQQMVQWHESGALEDLRRLVALAVREVVLLPAPDRGVDDNGQRRSTRGQRFNAADRVQIPMRLTTRAARAPTERSAP